MRFSRGTALPLIAAVAGAVGLSLVTSGPTRGADVIVGLITKTNINPFFVKMREGAEAKAKELGVTLVAAAGKVDGDNEGQVAAIENMIAQGAKGFAIVPSDSRAIVPTIKKARDAGLLVIDLDTPMDPMNSADATYATDNFKAGELIGEWARKTLGDKAKDAKIAMLDLTTSPVTVDYLRDHGFLHGFGIEYSDITKNGSEKDPRVSGHDVTAGNEEGGQKAMENLLQKDPNINLVYTINEPAAAGAYEALKAAGKEKGVMIVSIDGGCPGVKNVKAGIIGATSMQFPLLMASKAVETLAAYAKTGKKDLGPADKITDTGEQLITDKPVEGTPSINSDEGLKKCWG